MADFDPFASGQATLVDSPREEQAPFDPFASGEAMAVTPSKEKKEETFDPFKSGEAIDYKQLADKVEAAKPDLRHVDPTKGGLVENLKRGLGVLFAKKSLGQRYNESVDQAFTSNLPEVHRYQTDASDPAALQAAAGVENVANSAAAGAVSPGGASMLNPITAPAALLYAAPRFAIQGYEALKGIGKDKSVQENVENAVGGTLGVLGGVAGGLHGVKGITKQMPRVAPPEVKGPSLVDQMDADTHGNPTAANVAANEIAMKSPEPVAPVNPADNAVENINKGILAEGEPKAVEPESKIGPLESELAATPGGPEKLKGIKDTLASEKGYVQVSVWPEEYSLPGKGRMEQLDLIDPDNPQPGGIGSTFRELLKELGVEVPEIPKDIPPGNYTIDEIKDFAKKAEKPVETRTKTELLKEIAKSNPNADVDAPRQLLAPGKYSVKDVPIENIGDVFGKLTIQPKVVAEYVKNPPKEPIVLANVDGELRPVDGKHRLEAAIQRGDKTIKAWVQDKSPEPQAKESIEPKKDYLDELLATGEITKEEHAEQLAELGVKADAKPITVTAEAPSEFIIPKELSKSNPRYKTSEVVFQDPLDKALYIITQDAKRSARDSDFLDLVMEHTGMTEEEARAAGKEVRARIKALAASSEGEKITLKSSNKQAPENKVTPPKTIDAPPTQAAAPTDDPAPAPVSQSSGGGGSSGEPPVPPGQVPAPAPAFNNPIPNYGWTPFISSTKFGKFLKEKIGTIAGNIRAVSPELFGSVTERGFKINELKYDWSKSSRAYGDLGRRLLKPEAFTELDRLLQSGLHEEAANFIKGSKHETELTNAIGEFKKTLDAIRRAEINAGREVGLLDNYWIRQVGDYEGLRKVLGREPSNAVEKAVDAVKKQKKRALTAEEEQKVINDLISTSFSGQGKPGFLNARTIGEIQKNWFKYYEPSDVAIEQRINRAATDVVNRAYFGKFEPEGLAHSASGFIGAIEGNFGEIIRREIAAGKMSPEGSRVAVRNLQDFLRAESGYNEVTSKLATSIRKAQTYGYLSDLSSAIPQFGDFFLSAWRNGLLDSAKGFTNRRLDLGDIKLHQGTPDTAIYSKRNSEGLVGKVFRKAVQTSIGLADGFNKGGSLNTSFHEAARDMRDVNSDTYKRLDRKWSERYPNRWPEIKRDLQSDAFRKGDLNPNTQFFLYSELADIQPLSGEAYAQGYHQAGPFGKILYGLRSFAIKQLDVMRESGYEMMRSRDNLVRSEGLKNLVTYALVVGVGQQFLSSYMRDKLFNRDSNNADYVVSGLMSLVGLNRYAIYRAGDVGVGTAALETLVPGIGILNDAGQSAGIALKGLTGQRSQATGLKTIPDVPTALSKMQALKYIPWVGRELDAYLGPGAAREAKKKADAAAGKPQKNILQQIGESIVAPDTKS